MLFRQFLLLSGASACVLVASPVSLAEAAALRVGSGNEAVIEPPVPHPAETPCVVPLVTGAKFGANAVGYTYTPPAACPGPWATVVLSLDISLNQGRQFDRSGTLFLGGVPLWFGTTAEPRATLAPHWHVEKDVTDYTALYTTTQTGNLAIINYQDSTYTSTITASASLLFYPPTSNAPAPRTADVIVPLPAGGGVVTLNTGTDQLYNTAVLPNNILNATLDLYLQGQSSNEFWYTCVPTALATELQSCGGGALREGEVSVDGIPAGVAPIYPWIFTGGIDPYLWQPIPGVQTFDFTAFHADLSPFAGVLSSNTPHTIAASVYGANGYFSATGALRLFLDHNTATVTGSIIRNTLAAAPMPKIVQNITTTNGVTSGKVDTSDRRDFTISGEVTGSAGKIVNTLTQASHFDNNQYFDISTSRYVQDIEQGTDISIVTSASAAGTTSSRTQTLSYPLTVKLREAFAKSGNITQFTKIDQQYLENNRLEVDGSPVSQDSLSNAIQTMDTLFFNSSFQVTGHKSQGETASYLRTGTSLPCFKRLLVATFNVLTTVQTGC